MVVMIITKERDQQIGDTKQFKYLGRCTGTVKDAFQKLSGILKNRKI